MSWQFIWYWLVVSVALVCYGNRTSRIPFYIGAVILMSVAMLSKAY